MRNLIGMRIKLRVMSAGYNPETGRGGIIVKETPWSKNLVLDNGLDAMARGTGSTTPAGSFAFCHVGSGTNAVKTSSGAVTFTQAGTTLTASGGFFTVGMVGSLFKWGTGSGGAEQYITAFTSSTEVTVGTSATVGTPEVGVVWGVNQTTLQTQITTSNTYQTLTGDCGSSFSTPNITHKRTFVFPQQGSTMNVNEVGWSAAGGATVFGRLVLSSTTVVATTQFLVVIMQLTHTLAPATPTAVANVGTGGIDTAGNAMIEFLGFSGVTTTGTTSNGFNWGGGTIEAVLDGGEAGNGKLDIITQTYSQNANVSTSKATPAPTRLRVATGATLTKVSSVRGTAAWTYNQSITTNGETCFGFAIGRDFVGGMYFDVKFTSSFTLPVGTYQPNTVFRVVYDRALVN